MTVTRSLFLAITSAMFTAACTTDGTISGLDLNESWRTSRPASSGQDRGKGRSQLRSQLLSRALFAVQAGRHNANGLRRYRRRAVRWRMRQPLAQWTRIRLTATPNRGSAATTTQLLEVYVSITTVQTAALRCQRSGVSIEVSPNSPRSAKSTASETSGGGGSAAGGTSSGA
jgi:hypothetical protein